MKLLADVRRLTLKNDLHNARLVATQIAVYRRLIERNYESAVIIATKIQSMSSNHIINRAEVETIKGMKHANKGQSIGSVEVHENKYDQRMKLYESMEEIMTEGMDEVYHDVPLLFSRDTQPQHTIQEHVVDSILKHAVSEKNHVREYFEYDDPQLQRKRIVLHFRVVREDFLSTSIYIDTLDISVDMLKRSLIKDPAAIEQLDLAKPAAHTYEKTIRTAKPFILGRFVAQGSLPPQLTDGGSMQPNSVAEDGAGIFQPFAFSESLKNLGLASNEIIWILPTNGSD